MIDPNQAPSQTPTPEPAADEERSMPAEELARKGAIILALLAAAGALLVAFNAISDAIRTWLEPRWVPVWQALFALAVAGLALWVVHRLTQ